ncbi:ethanolaminephosphotransferase 1-like [Acanthaster planci]|uniref:Ethanolaminephosphotransferase 1-like n=1 Tax=Acanthaster planci TaxID=133434 RepID=A0A8B7Z0X5_ACAPL|nr:ethanolaminephosphotransferase 1-like [Acanthaster planci]
MASIYLSEKHLRGFDKYKYNAVDTSPLSIYIMHPFWNAVVKIFPEWFAPNLMTFLGFLIISLSFIMLSITDWSYYAASRQHPQYPPIPNLVFLLAGAGLLVAHTLDGIDGKQARRTKSSTPLGELFDHGSDSVISCLLPLCVFSVFGRGEEDYGANVWMLYALVCVICTTFYISHWEKYLTGIMFLPWAYDFSQLALVVVYIVTGIFGYDIWKGTYAYGFQFRYFFILTTLGGSLILSLPNTIWNIYVSYKDGTGKNRSPLRAVEPGVPVMVLLVVATLWAAFSPTDILQLEPRIFCLTVGITLSNIACRLIISQMTETRAKGFNWLLVPLMIATAISLWTDLGPTELYFLYALAAVTLLAHFHYTISVVIQLADHFNVYIFSLEKRSPKGARPPSGNGNK